MSIDNPLSTNSESCCDTFWDAQDYGTDNEGYGKLIYPIDRQKPCGWQMGCDLPPIEYCPWCGRKL